MTNQVPPDKNFLRKMMRARRHGVSPTTHAKAGRQLAATLSQCSLLSKGSFVASYLSLPDELPTVAVNAALYNKGCYLSVPAWSSPTKSYQMVEWRTDTPLKSGPMQVPEPQQKRWVATKSIDVFFVPGLAFDLFGGRIGFGKGHYDRLLAERQTDAICVAVCYDWQLLKRVPQESFDIAMDWIATPTQLLPVTKRGAV